VSQVLVGAWLWGLLLLWVWVAVSDVLFGAFACWGWSWLVWDYLLGFFLSKDWNFSKKKIKKKFRK